MPRMNAHPSSAALAARFEQAQASAPHVGETLYRAALGPVNAQRYLAAFERLDATGRALPGWNWAAAVCTLGWMAFRGLGQALAWYVAGWAALALACAALLQLGAELPAPVLAGLLLAGALLACALPGLYGDVLVHRQVRRRIDAAVNTAPTLQEAIAQLQAGGATRARLLGVSLGCAALALAGAGLWLYVAGLLPPLGQAPEPSAPASSGAADAAASAAPLAGASAAIAAAIAPASSSASAAAVASAASAAPAASSEPVVAAPARAPASGAGAGGQAARDGSVAAPAALGTASAAVAPASPASRTPATATAAATAATPSPAPAVVSGAPPRAASSAQGSAAAPVAAPAASAARPGAGGSARAAQPRAAAAAAASGPASAPARQLYINVGLFAEPGNARRAHARLLAAGLPSAVREVTAADGRRLQRVRVGPFQSASEANAAVARVQALGLDAAAAASAD